MKKQSEPNKVLRGMYFWKTNLYLSEQETHFLKNHDIQKLYTKIMDIDWNAVYEAYPTTSTHIEEELKKDTLFEIVPVIFITNESIKQTWDIDTLSKKIILKTKQLCGTQYSKIKELQIDCDWTPQTKEKYFDLLHKLKKLAPQLQLSATLRLHQLKYKSKTGVPPVDRVTLMLYNMGKLGNYSETNSILNINETKKYINGLRYDLPIDFILPLFNWALKFSNKQFDRIVYNVNRTTFDTCKAFVKQANGYYKVINDYYTLDQDYYYFGDEIRVEDIRKQDLMELSRLCAKKATSHQFTVSFFELNPYYINTIDSAAYEEIYHTFR
ncbi:MAG: hypothetical protein V4580_03990 [Bacteroidota bacterium]